MGDSEESTRAERTSVPVLLRSQTGLCQFLFVDGSVMESEVPIGGIEPGAVRA